MSENTPTPAAPVTPPAAPVTPPVSPAPRAAEPEMFSREYVTELRRENAHYRTKANESEAAKTAAERAAEDGVKTIKQEADARIIRSELKAEAIKAGMIDLDGLKLADLSKVKLTDTGDVEGATELLAALKESKPYLFGATNNSSTPGDPPKPKPNEPRDVRTMTREEYAKAKADAARASRR